jgi:flagellar hook-basal body complex protein FliE
MANPIGPVSPAAALPALEAVAPLSSASSAGATAFRDAFSGALDRVDRARVGADQLTRSFLAGEGGELHNVVLATQQAELAFEVAQQVRNKVVQAYQEIMRMQM